MSQLREQLEAARENYLSARYPGELAQQVLPLRRAWWSRWVGTAVAGAAAAIVVAVVVHENLKQAPMQRVVAPAGQPKRPVFVVLPGLPQAPKSMTLAPALGDKPVFLPALPTFPSLLETLSEPQEPWEIPDQNLNATEAL